MNSLARYTVAESRLWEAYGIRPEIGFLDLPQPWGLTRVMEWGSGQPVLLVHGGGGQGGSDFTPLLANLRGVRGISVDRPGSPHHGVVDHSRLDLRGYAVGFLEAVLNGLGLPRAPFVANSMGGLWTFWLALDRPDRVTAITQIGCPAFILDTSVPAVMRLLSVPWLGERLLRMGKPSVAMARRMARQLGHGASLAEERIEPAFYEYIAATSAMESYAPTFASLVRRVISLRGPRPGYSVGSVELRSIDQPTLFIWGEKDPFGGAEVGRKAAGMMRDATIEVLADAGHLPWLDDAARCGSWISHFLQANQEESADLPH